MYSTKLTVSHSICSELTPPPPQRKEHNSRLSFCPSFFFSIFFFCVLHSKSFTSDKVVKSTQCASPCTYYVQSKCVHPTSLSSKLNTRFQYFKKTKQKRGMGTLRKFTVVFFFFPPFFFSCQSVWSGNNLQKKQKSNTTFSSIWIYKKMQCRKNTLFG